MIREMVGAGLARTDLSPPSSIERKTVLAVRGPTADGLGPVDVEVRAGEIRGVAGLMGSGRSRLLHTVMGAQPRTGGPVTLDGAEPLLGMPGIAARPGEGVGRGRDRIWPDPPRAAAGVLSPHRATAPVQEDQHVLAKVFPIKLKAGNQAKAEELVEAFAPHGPGREDGTLSFRVYRDPANTDYLLFVEHFADQAAYDAHTGSAAYRELIAGQFADLIVEFVEIDHELLVAF